MRIEILIQQELALSQIVNNKQNLIDRIYRTSNNNIYSIMAPVLDEANLADEHAKLMLDMKSEFEKKMDEFHLIAVRRLDAVKQRIKAIREADGVTLLRA